MKNFNVLSIILGSLIATCSIVLIESLFCMFYFYPSAEIILDPGLLKSSIAALSLGFYLPVICLNVAISFIAGTLPVVMGNEKLKYSCVIGVITASFVLIMGYLIPFPVWFSIISVLTILPASYLGGFFLKRMFVRMPIAITFYQ